MAERVIFGAELFADGTFGGDEGAAVALVAALFVGRPPPDAVEYSRHEEKQPEDDLNAEVAFELFFVHRVGAALGADFFIHFLNCDFFTVGSSIARGETGMVRVCRLADGWETVLGSHSALARSVVPGVFRAGSKRGLLFFDA